MDETPPLQLRPPTDVDAKVAAMQEAIVSIHRLITELDKRYEQRFVAQEKAVESALVAVKEQTSSSFAASKEAITEAKKSQDVYNSTHNDLVRKMERQASELITRTQAEDKIHTVDEKIGAMSKTYEQRLERTDAEVRMIREAQNTQQGKGQGMENLWAKILALISALGAIGFGIAFVAK